MPKESASWLRWILGMGERRKLGDVALDLLLFAGMVSSLPDGLHASQMLTSSALSDDSWTVHGTNLSKPDSQWFGRSR